MGPVKRTGKRAPPAAAPPPPSDSEDWSEESEEGLEGGFDEEDMDGEESDADSVASLDMVDPIPSQMAELDSTTRRRVYAMRGHALAQDAAEAEDLLVCAAVDKFFLEEQKVLEQLLFKPRLALARTAGHCDDADIALWPAVLKSVAVAAGEGIGEFPLSDAVCCTMANVSWRYTGAPGEPLRSVTFTVDFLPEAKAYISNTSADVTFTMHNPRPVLDGAGNFRWGPVAAMAATKLRWVGEHNFEGEGRGGSVAPLSLLFDRQHQERFVAADKDLTFPMRPVNPDGSVDPSRKPFKRAVRDPRTAYVEGAGPPSVEKGIGLVQALFAVVARAGEAKQAALQILGSDELDEEDGDEEDVEMMPGDGFDSEEGSDDSDDDSEEEVPRKKQRGEGKKGSGPAAPPPECNQQ